MDGAKENLQPQCAPVSGGRSNLKIILSALPRYVQGRCCEDQLHLTNFGTKEYATEIGTSLAQIPTWLDDLAHGKRITEYEVLCVSSAIGLEDNPSKRELAKLWGSDPVHLTPEGYKKLGEKIVEQVSTRKPKPANPGKKKDAERRPGLSRSDLIASRWDRDTGKATGKRPYSGKGAHQAPKRKF